MAVVSPGAVVADAAAVGTFSGNEITDATRAAALLWPTTQQGGSTDGLTPPAGAGMWSARTNLFTHGQCDSVSTWGLWGSGTSVNVDSATPAPFSPQSVKVVTPGSVANEGSDAHTPNGQAAAVGTVGVGSLYVNVPVGVQIDIWMRWTNTDLSVTDGAKTTHTGTGAWVEIAPASVAVAAGETGDFLTIFARTHGTAAVTYHLAHGQLESGPLYVSPYIATSQGASAARSAARVQLPSSLVTPTQGWFAARVLFGFNSSLVTGLGGSFFTVAMLSQDSSNYIALFYRAGDNSWRMRSEVAASSAGDCLIINAQSAGDEVTVCGYWTSTTLGVSVNGSAFVTVNPSSLPTFTTPTLDVGTFRGGGVIDGTVQWFACGAGVMTAADASYFNGLPNIMPALFPEVAAGVSARWLTYAPVGPKFRRVRVGEPVVRVG